MSDDHERSDPGLARERTGLAWTRTSIAFAAVGGVIVRRELVAGLLVLALSPLIWVLGRYLRHPDQAGPRPVRLLLVTVIVTLVSLVAVVVAVIGVGPQSIQDVVSLRG
jgi:uncharacterized membrane protein YidH (DUF202 family)